MMILIRLCAQERRSSAARQDIRSECDRQAVTFPRSIKLHNANGETSHSICTANFEPQIQVKSKAVDTGRSPSFAHLSDPVKGRTHCGHGVGSPKSFACAMKKEALSWAEDFV
jgi:hypothetical protein